MTSRRVRRAALTGVAAALVLSAVALLLFTPAGLARVLLRNNFQAVLPGEVYRSGQPTRADLEAWSARVTFKTVINLRGNTRNRPWFRMERAFAAERGMAHHTVRLNADRLPSTTTLGELIRLIDTAERPILFHCEGGIERSGLAAAVTRLLDGDPPAEALDEFHRRKGFIRALAFSDLPEVIELYAAWLEGSDTDHTPIHFRRWAKRVYVPYFYRAELRVVDPAARPLEIDVRNRSPLPIALRPDAPPGVRLGARAYPLRADGGAERGSLPIWEWRGDVPRRELAPGEEVRLALRVPAEIAGRPSVVVVDLVNEGVKWFETMGSRPLELTLDPAHP